MLLKIINCYSARISIKIKCFMQIAFCGWNNQINLSIYLKPFSLFVFQVYSKFYKLVNMKFYVILCYTTYLVIVAPQIIYERQYQWQRININMETNWNYYRSDLMISLCFSANLPIRKAKKLLTLANSITKSREKPILPNLNYLYVLHIT